MHTMVFSWCVSRPVGSSPLLAPWLPGTALAWSVLFCVSGETFLSVGFLWYLFFTFHKFISSFLTNTSPEN